jgi:hypothetical protein
MSLAWIIVIVLILFAVVGAPNMGIWNHGFGYWPSGLGGLIVLVLVVLLLTGKL